MSPNVDSAQAMIPDGHNINTLAGVIIGWIQSENTHAFVDKPKKVIKKESLH